MSCTPVPGRKRDIASDEVPLLMLEVKRKSPELLRSANVCGVPKVPLTGAGAALPNGTAATVPPPAVLRKIVPDAPKKTWPALFSSHRPGEVNESAKVPPSG